MLLSIGDQIVGANEKIREETERRQKWKKENERRRHNYVPLIFELLQQMGKKQMLDNLFKDAVQKKKEKQEESKKDKDGDQVMKD